MSGASSPLRRKAAVNLTWEQANELFDTCVTATNLSPKKLFCYNKSKPEDWKKAIVWSEIRNQRAVLSSLLDLTQGRLIKHRSFMCQLSTWLNNRQLVWSMSDVEKAVYSLRTMLAHLRDFARLYRKGKKSLPRGFEQMQTLVDKMALEESSLEEEEEACQGEADDFDSENDDDEVCVVPAAKKKPRMLIAISSNESDINLDSLGEALFKPAAGNPEVGVSEMDSLIDEALDVEPPTAEEMKARRGEARLVAKRPAAATDAGDFSNLDPMPAATARKRLYSKLYHHERKMSLRQAMKRPAAAADVCDFSNFDPLKLPVATARKRLYNKFYHERKELCLRNGIDADEAKAQGRSAAQAVIHEWEKHFALHD